MNDTLIINGITYKAVKEEKKPERLEGWIVRDSLAKHKAAQITESKMINDDTRMVELRSGEIIVSEDDVRRAWDNCIASSNHYELFIKLLGFKKDGAE